MASSVHAGRGSPASQCWLLGLPVRLISAATVLLGLAATERYGHLWHNELQMRHLTNTTHARSVPLRTPARLDERCAAATPATTTYACPPWSFNTEHGIVCCGITEHDVIAHVATEAAERAQGQGCQARVADAGRSKVVWPSTATAESVPCLELGVPHVFTITSRDVEGLVPCHGGDYYEGNLEGDSVRTRVRVTDHGNGTYAAELHLPDDDALVGHVRLDVILLWRAWGGAQVPGGGWEGDVVDLHLMRAAPLRLARYGQCHALPPAARADAATVLPAPSTPCRSVDFMAAPFWRGHWVRLPDPAVCPSGVCTGSPSMLVEGFPWVYRLEACFFHFFPRHEARALLNHTWVFASGDSMMRDFNRLILDVLLGAPVEGWLDDRKGTFCRTHDVAGFRPVEENEQQCSTSGAQVGWDGDALTEGFFTRTSCIFNGAWPNDGAGMGLQSILQEGFLAEHTALLDVGAKAAHQAGPDVLIANSGLHDAMSSVGVPLVFQDYAGLFSDAALFFRWLQNTSAATTAAAVDNPAAATLCRPRLVWRSSVAVASHLRRDKVNPQKVEVYNRIAATRLMRENQEIWQQQARDALAPDAAQVTAGVQCSRRFHSPRVDWAFLDVMDMSWPWHYHSLGPEGTIDGEAYSDGVHYGRVGCPGNLCHAVETVTVHVLLNGLLPL